MIQAKTKRQSQTFEQVDGNRVNVPLTKTKTVHQYTISTNHLFKTTHVLKGD